jgi:diguanylate cyclase (GGDEF)-like protein
MSHVILELAQTDLFRDVPEAVIRLVREQGSPQELVAGEILLSPEIESDCVYLLLSGVLTIHFGLPNSPPIRELRKGASVGEMSVIDCAPPSAYAIAKEASRVFPIHRDLLQNLIGHNNPMGRNLIQMLSRWMKTNTERIVKDRGQIAELTDHANVDGLTGLYNRRWLDNAFGRLLTQAAKGNQALCILILDVDHFKKYNDTHGHLGGDQALIALGNVLKTTLRPYDFATRFGGEEFLILLPNTTREEGLATAERIRIAAEKLHITLPDSTPLSGITVSIGLAMNQGDATPTSAIAAADGKLYEAKKAGRNCVKATPAS